MIGMLKPFLCWLFLFCGSCIVNAQQHALQQFLATDGLQHASVGIAIRAVSDGKEILNHRAETALTPASVLKLLPTWFALQEKGEKYRFQTTVYHTGEIQDSVLRGDLVVEAGGDPTLNSRYFPQTSFLDELLNFIQQQGVCCIKGTIRVEGAVKGEEIPGSWLWEDISNYYGALYLPFTYRDNLFSLRFQTKEPGSQAKLLSVVPELSQVKIRNEVRASSEKDKNNAWIFGGPYSEVLAVRGTLPAHRTAITVRGALHDPATVFLAELKDALQNRQIIVEEQEFLHHEKKRWFVFQSPTLSEIVYHTNKVSVNLFAEALGFLIGEETSEKGIQLQLEQMGLDVSGMILKDVCGLSLMNAVPAQLFTDLLVHIAQQNSSVFLNSLPVAGQDGGLNGYCQAFPELKGRIQAKTGSMSGIRGLSGYLIRKDGTRLAFTILVNHYTCSVSQLQKAIGHFLRSFL